jgi:hemerythrin-like domain-containing protein
MGKATQDLRKEHDAILHVLGIMDKMMSADIANADRLKYYGEVVHFLQVFADKCHHGKEENYLFVELVNNGVPNERGPVGVMLQEHNQGRGYIASMKKSLESQDVPEFDLAAGRYGNLLRSHIDKENNVLFVMADRVLDEEKQNAMFEIFEQYEENVMGHGVHEELHSMIRQWSEVFEAR